MLSQVRLDSMSLLRFPSEPSPFPSVLYPFPRLLLNSSTWYLFGSCIQDFLIFSAFCLHCVYLSGHCFICLCTCLPVYINSSYRYPPLAPSQVIIIYVHISSVSPACTCLLSGHRFALPCLPVHTFFPDHLPSSQVIIEQVHLGIILPACTCLLSGPRFSPPCSPVHTCLPDPLPLSQVIIVYGLIAYKPLSADDPEKYPWWTDVIGWGMAGSSMIMIPFVAIYKIVRVPGPASLKQVLTRAATGRGRREHCYHIILFVQSCRQTRFKTNCILKLRITLTSEKKAYKL